VHESRLAADIIRQAAKVATNNDSGRVQIVRIKIGALNHATPRTLANLLEDMALGTSIQGATFEISKSEDMTDPKALDVRLVSMTVGDS